MHLRDELRHPVRCGFAKPQPAGELVGGEAGLLCDGRQDAGAFHRGADSGHQAPAMP